MRESEPARPRWIVVGGDETASDLAGAVPDVEVQVADPGTLSTHLASARARLVVVCHPPATSDDVHAAAIERQRPRSPIRVVLLTADADIAGRLTALDAGFDDALPVSLDPRELVARLRRLGLASRPSSVSRPHAVRGPIAIASDVELDLHAYELRRSGIAQRLRPKELQLLALLATNPRRAFSRRELIDRIWGTSFLGDQRTIDVHLRWLRSKIEEDPEHPVHLITVRGRGYRFDPPSLTHR